MGTRFSSAHRDLLLEDDSTIWELMNLFRNNEDYENAEDVEVCYLMALKVLLQFVEPRCFTRSVGEKIPPLYVFHHESFLLSSKKRRQVETIFGSEHCSIVFNAIARYAKNNQYSLHD